MSDKDPQKGTDERVTGIGGIFFKARDPEGIKRWYQQHLGIKDPGGLSFAWRHADDPERKGHTVWAPFSADTKYFAPSQAPFMINYRVADMDRLLAQLRQEGVEIDRREDSEYGRFAWIMDPEGNRIELWEPPPGH